MLIDLNNNVKEIKIDGFFGIQLYDDGTMYTGYFSKQNGKMIPDDIGKILHSGGEEYSGQIKLGRITGYGMFENCGSADYVGEWKNEYQNGYGVESFSDGSSFKGQFENGKKIRGTYSWKDGSYYEGEFMDNNFYGYVSILIVKL